MKNSKQDLIIEKIEANRSLIKILTLKVEKLIEMNKSKKKKKPIKSNPIKKIPRKLK